MTSPDGITWTSRTPAADNNWRSVCWSSELSLFVAVATSGTGDRVMTSQDGVTWTARTSAADNQWRSVCWASELSLFVAVADSGTGNRVMTSPNGITWTARTSAADNSWVSVCWASELSLFVAVAASGTGNRVMTSPNGITWTARTSANDNQWFSVCWSSELSLFVAVASTGTGNRVMTSPDGITWTARTSAADNGWLSVCWAAELSLFVAVAYTGTGDRVMTSPNGITWTTRTSAADNQWRSVCWAAELSLFVAVANSGTGDRVMTSAIGMPNSKSVVKALPSQMMVSATGNVGIGTTNPLAKLHVQGDLSISGSIFVNQQPSISYIALPVAGTLGLNTANNQYPYGSINVISGIKYIISGVLYIAKTAGTTSRINYFTMSDGTAGVSAAQWRCNFAVSGTAPMNSNPTGPALTLFWRTNVSEVTLSASETSQGISHYLDFQGEITFSSGGTFRPRWRYSVAPGGAPTFFGWISLAPVTPTGWA